MMRGRKRQRCAAGTARRQRPQQCYAQRCSLHLTRGVMGTELSTSEHADSDQCEHQANAPYRSPTSMVHVQHLQAGSVGTLWWPNIGAGCLEVSCDSELAHWLGAGAHFVQQHQRLAVRLSP
jgi:hypothetical protein